MMIRRWMPVKSQVLLYPKVRNDLGAWSNWKPSQTKRVVFEGVFSQEPTYFAPYIFGGVQEDTEKNESSNTYESNICPYDWI